MGSCRHDLNSMWAGSAAAGPKSATSCGRSAARAVATSPASASRSLSKTKPASACIPGEELSQTWSNIKGNNYPLYFIITWYSTYNRMITHAMCYEWPGLAERAAVREGGAAESGSGPEAVRVDEDRLARVLHPRGGARHGLALFGAEFRGEVDGGGDEPGRHGEDGGVGAECERGAGPKRDTFGEYSAFSSVVDCNVSYLRAQVEGDAPVALQDLRQLRGDARGPAFESGASGASRSYVSSNFTDSPISSLRQGNTLATLGFQPNAKLSGQRL